MEIFGVSVNLIYVFPQQLIVFLDCLIYFIQIIRLSSLIKLKDFLVKSSYLDLMLAYLISNISHFLLGLLLLAFLLLYFLFCLLPFFWFVYLIRIKLISQRILNFLNESSEF